MFGFCHIETEHLGGNAWFLPYRNRAFGGNAWVLPYKNRAFGVMFGFCLIETERQGSQDVKVGIFEDY